MKHMFAMSVKVILIIVDWQQSFSPTGDFVVNVNSLGDNPIWFRYQTLIIKEKVCQNIQAILYIIDI